MYATQLAAQWYERFSRLAIDLYPGRYTHQVCFELAELAIEIKRRAAEKNSRIVAHNYLYPEFHEIADDLGDSLGLAQRVREINARRVDFQSVYFMGATAKIINEDATRVFVSDTPDVLNCSLVLGTDYTWLKHWKKKNPDGILVTYVNSDAYVKAMSDYIGTSRNMDKVIVTAAERHPDQKILVLPDRFLGMVMRARAMEQGVDGERIEVYSHPFQGYNASCYVHEKIGEKGIETALDTYPEAELLIHPECGCASSCLLKLEQGIIPRSRAYFCSTEQMVTHARTSEAPAFIVATEKGMIYRLRKEVPNKIFYPVSLQAECRYMKANTLEKLLRSLQEDRLEIVLCNDCCDPEHSYQDASTVHIQRSIATRAKVAIDRMLAIQ